MLRDAAFALTMLCAPAADALPPVGAWAPSKAALSWALDEDGQTLRVSAFGIDALKCAGYAPSEAAGGKGGGGGFERGGGAALGLRTLLLGERVSAPRLRQCCCRV